jgi:two-component system response regulator YesN
MAYHLIRLADLVRTHLDVEPRLRLSQLSWRLGVSRQTLEKAVRAATGKSFRQCRSELLVVKARELLTSDGTRSIKEIAYSLGYRSPQAFARYVKMASGQSPSQLRENFPPTRAA